MRVLIKLAVPIFVAFVWTNAAATLGTFEAIANDCAGIGIDMERPFDFECSFTDLPALAGDEVTLFGRARGDINGIDEYLEIDADGFGILLFAGSATIVNVFGATDYEMIDVIPSQSFLPIAISDGALTLSIRGSAGLASINISDLGIRYLTDATTVPEPGTVALFALGLFGMVFMQRKALPTVSSRFHMCAFNVQAALN